MDTQNCPFLFIARVCRNATPSRSIEAMMAPSMVPRMITFKGKNRISYLAHPMSWKRQPESRHFRAFVHAPVRTRQSSFPISTGGRSSLSGGDRVCADFRASQRVGTVRHGFLADHSCSASTLGGLLARNPLAAEGVEPFWPWRVCFAGDLAVWHWSIKLTLVANATLEANMSSLFVALFAWRFLVALAVALFGTVLLVGKNAHMSVLSRLRREGQTAKSRDEFAVSRTGRNQGKVAGCRSRCLILETALRGSGRKFVQGSCPQ